jgi:hypothetical protein
MTLNWRLVMLRQTKSAVEPAFEVEQLEGRLCLSSSGHHHAHHKAHHAQHGHIDVKASPSAASSSIADSSLVMNDLALIPPIAGSAFSVVPLPTIPPVATVLIPPIGTVQIPPIATVQVPPIATVLIPPVAM